MKADDETCSIDSFLEIRRQDHLLGMSKVE